MAANSLGNQHSAYAVSLQNLGLYYDVIKNDTSKANEFFARARAVLKENNLPLTYLRADIRQCGWYVRLVPNPDILSIEFSKIASVAPPWAPCDQGPAETFGFQPPLAKCSSYGKSTRILQPCGGMK